MASLLHRFVFTSSQVIEKQYNFCICICNIDKVKQSDMCGGTKNNVISLLLKA